jgi:LmbE family N-acetylglucosaminyl deacetylase
VYHYVQDYYTEPSFVVDITGFWDQKLESIMAYKTQFFNPDSKEPETPISTRAFLDFLEGRAAQYGRLIGAKHGEGFVSARPVGTHSLFDII